MSTATRVLYWLSLAVLSVSLLYPCFERAMAWKEAAPVAYAGLFFVSLWGALSVKFMPARIVAAGPFAVATASRKTAMTLGAIGVGYCVLVGGFVTYHCEESLSSARSRPAPSYGSPYGSPYGQYGGPSSIDRYASSLDAAYESQDRVGKEIGQGTLGMTIVPLIGLIVYALRKPDPALAHAYPTPGPWQQPYAPGQPMQPYAPGHAMQPHAQGPYPHQQGPQYAQAHQAQYPGAPMQPHGAYAPPQAHVPPGSYGPTPPT